MHDLNTSAARDERSALYSQASTNAGSSGVSWPAIFAGAAAAASLSLILLILGTGFGFAAVSPWTSQGISATTFGVSTILWILFVAIVASGAGGYLAGRLRVKWDGTHTDEVYFRDTAHGFLSWSIATLVTAAVLTSTVGSIVGSTAQASSMMVGAAGSAATSATASGMSAMSHSGDESGSGMQSLGYFTDALFRPSAATGSASAHLTNGSTAPVPAAAAPATSAAEVTRIFVRGLQGGSLAPEDTTYVGQLVAQRTGMSQPDAEKRVTDTFAKAKTALQEAETKAKQAADTARKAAAYGALWVFISLLLGAFSASYAATFGGRQRDLF